jgi:DNA-binding NarL/FixJ family response regulator
MNMSDLKRPGSYFCCTGMTTGILIYEDNENLGNSIRTLFQWNDTYKVLAVLQHPVNILTDIKVHQPGVILMDIDMPVLNGVQALRLLRQHGVTLPVIMLTVFEDDENILEAIRAGANGYLLKKNMDRLVPSIQEVLGGGAPMSAYVARRVLQLFANFGNRPGAETEFDLSNREKEILDHLVKGFSYKMIADKLEISVDTIRSHIKKIYKKLEVNSATEAIYKYTHSR